jgi:hypothetical protein
MYFKVSTSKGQLTSSFIIALMMESVSTSEMSINFYQTTWCNIPEDGPLHTCCRVRLRYHPPHRFFLEQVMDVPVIEKYFIMELRFITNVNHGWYQER